MRGHGHWEMAGLPSSVREGLRAGAKLEPPCLIASANLLVRPQVMLTLREFRPHPGLCDHPWRSPALLRCPTCNGRLVPAAILPRVSVLLSVRPHDGDGVAQRRERPLQQPRARLPGVHGPAHASGEQRGLDAARARHTGASHCCWKPRVRLVTSGKFRVASGAVSAGAREQAWQQRS